MYFVIRLGVRHKLGLGSLECKPRCFIFRIGFHLLISINRDEGMLVIHSSSSIVKALLILIKGTLRVYRVHILVKSL